MNDPLGLSAFTAHILGSFEAMAPYAAIGLIVILLAYGARKAL